MKPWREKMKSLRKIKPAPQLSIAQQVDWEREREQFNAMKEKKFMARVEFLKNLDQLPEEERCRACLAEVHYDSRMYYHVPDKHKNHVVTVCALEQDGMLLERVPTELLHTHPELIDLAIKQNPCAIRSVPVELCTPEIIEMAMTSLPEAYHLIPGGLQTEELERRYRVLLWQKMSGVLASTVPMDIRNLPPTFNGMS